MSTPIRALVLALLLFFMADGVVRAQTATTGAASGVTDLAATLNGTFDSGSSGSWDVYFDFGTGTTYGSTAFGSPYFFPGHTSQATSYTFTDLQPNTTYHYRVNAESLGVGGHQYGQDMTFTTGPPATPPSIQGTVEDYSVEKEHIILYIPKVYSGAAPSTVVVEYGPTTDYEATKNLANLSINGSVESDWLSLNQLTLSGLTPGTTYHVRLKVSSAVATVVSPDASFTTLIPASLTTGAATNVTDLSATLNGTLLENGNTLGQFFVEYGATTAYGQSANISDSGTDPQALAYTITKLLPNTVYHYQFTAYDSEDGAVYGGDQVFTTGAPATPPAFTGGVSVFQQSPMVAMPSESSVYGGSSPTTVLLEYGATMAYGTVAQVPGMVDTNAYSGASVTLFTLQPGATYHARFTATNAQGSVSTPDFTFTMAPAPLIITGAAASVTDLNAVLNGTVNPQGGDTIYPEFEWGTDTTYGHVIATSSGPFYDANTHAVSVQPAGLQPGTTYHYRLRGYDATEAYFYGADATFTTAAAATPPTVGGVIVFSVGATEASLLCSVTSGSSPTTVYFDYGTTTSYSSTVTAGDPLSINSNQFTQIVLNGLSVLTTYHVRCRVVNHEGSATSADLAFTTSGIPAVTTGPATSIADLSAMLNGSVIANGPSTPAYPSFDFGTDTAYGNNVVGSPDGILSSALTPFTGAAIGLLPNTTYHYRAKVYYSSNNLTFYGPDVSFTTGAAATLPTVSAAFTNAVSDTSAAVEATTVTAGSSDATVIWEFGPTTAYGSMVTSNPGIIRVSTSDNATAVITGLTPGTTYHYRCTATNAQGSTSSADAAFTTAVSPVLVTDPQYTATDLTAGLSGSVTFNGMAYTSFVGFYFEWGTDGTYGTITHANGVGNTTALTLTATATGLLPSTVYHYRAKGQAKAGNWYYGQDQTLTTGPPNTPPTIVTGLGTPITTTGETLYVSSLQTGSSAATVSYEYGLDTTYGTTVVYPTTLAPSQTYGGLPLILINGSNGPFFPVAVTGLTPGTTYHFRAKAANNEGVSYGADATFTTAGPPVLTTMAPTDLGTVSALLNGTINGSGVDYTPSFDYGLTTDYGSKVPGFGLFVVGIGGIGGGTIGGTINFGVIGSTLTGSSGVTNVAYTAGNGEVIDLLDWTTYNGATFTGTSTSTGTTTSSGTLTLPTLGSGITDPIAGALAGPVSGSVTGLQPNTTYHCRIKATDSDGNSFYGNDITFTTIGPDALAQNWRQGYFGSPDNSGFASDMGNPSGDGIPNLLKYALGINPDVPANSAVPQPVLKTFDGITYLDLTFQRDSAMTDLTYAVQAADSPAGPWTTIASSVGGAATTGPGLVTENSLLSLENIAFSFTPNTVYVVEVRDIVSTTDAPRRFLRLQITRP